MATIDMQAMRHINLLDKISNVKTRKCFTYNNTLYFVVNEQNISRAIGPSANNIKKIQESLGKKVKIIKEPSGVEDSKNFIESIVSPITPRNVEVKENQIIITAGGTQNKASLIGRNKRRYEELKKILEDTFGKELKIM